jgi:glycerophosphoryl diester phosphodiesterase
MKIFGHRGAFSHAPENTLTAFSKAAKLGADGVEFDIQLTKDNQIVVIHDETLDRTSGNIGRVRDHTLEELKTINVNRRIANSPPFMPIPTLGEVLELLAPTDLLINIELKTSIIPYDIEKAAVALVNKYGLSKRVIWSSFNHYSLKKLRKYAPEADLALLSGGIVITPEECAALGAAALHIDIGRLRFPGLIEDCKSAGIKLRAWTVNDPTDIRFCMENDIDIITNVVDTAVFERERKAFSLREYAASSPWKDSALAFYPYKDTAKILFDPAPDEFTEENLKKYCHEGKRTVIIYPNPTALSKWAAAKGCVPGGGQGGEIQTGSATAGTYPCTGSAPTKAELTQRLTNAGFAAQKWYYPVANHYFTDMVFSEKYLPKNAFFDKRPFMFMEKNPDRRFSYTYTPEQYEEIVKNGVFEFFTESYFVECLPGTDEGGTAAGETPCEVDFAALTLYREPYARLATLISGDTVRKTPLTPEALDTPRKTYENHVFLRSIGINALECEMDGNDLTMQRMDYPTLWEIIDERFRKNTLTFEDLAKWFDQIRDDIFTAARAGRLMWEMVPANIFINGDELIYFDQEISTETGDKYAVLARAVKAFDYAGMTEKNPKFTDFLKARYFLSSNWIEYETAIKQNVDSIIRLDVRDAVYDFARRS